jgi:hypothetical protein
LNRIPFVTAGLASLAALCGCSAPGPVATRSLPEPARAGIYSRADAGFENAVLFKPAEQDRTNLPAFKLAPLVIQQVAGSDPVPELDAFGIPSTAQTQSAVYFRRDRVLIHGRAHGQFTYFWGYPPGTAAQTAGPVPRQGVRITLDAAGRPVIWEILSDSSGARILFVAQSLETAAAAQFGKARPGRRYSVEGDLAAAPDTVVAGLVDDGPVPMGPIVYLFAGSRDASAVICRCMPARARRLLGEGYYELVDAGREVPRELPAPPPERLEQQLRLPPDF